MALSYNVSPPSAFMNCIFIVFLSKNANFFGLCTFQFSSFSKHKQYVLKVQRSKVAT